MDKAMQVTTADLAVGEPDVMEADLSAMVDDLSLAFCLSVVVIVSLEVMTTIGAQPWWALALAASALIEALAMYFWEFSPLCWALGVKNGDR